MCRIFPGYVVIFRIRRIPAEILWFVTHIMCHAMQILPCAICEKKKQNEERKFEERKKNTKVNRIFV